MDISRIKNKDLKVWLPMMDGVEVQCRHLPRGEFSALRQQAVKISYDPRTKEKIEKLDDRKLESAMARAMVIDWRGITDGDQEWPCTPENIDYLMTECVEFRTLILETPLSLEKMLAAEQAAAEKNLSTTSGQELTTQA